MARRQITETIGDIDAASLPDLTDKQNKFVHGILSGLTASDAYRAAYDCSNMKPSSIWRDASLLRSHPNVAQWLTAARMAGLATAATTLETHIAALDRIIEKAIASGNYGAAVQAEIWKGKVCGLGGDKLEISVDDPMRTLRDIERVLGPDVAAGLAKADGITWEPTKH